MPVRATFSTVDRKAKKTSMSFLVADAAESTEIQAVVTALDAILLGADVRGVISEETVIDAGSAVAPTNKDCTRFRKWQIQIQDNTTSQVYTHEIGTADGAQLPSSTDDYLNLASGVGAALKTAIEAVYESPDGNAGTVIFVREVSRTGND